MELGDFYCSFGLWFSWFEYLRQINTGLPRESKRKSKGKESKQRQNETTAKMGRSTWRMAAVAAMGVLVTGSSAASSLLDVVSDQKNLTTFLSLLKVSLIPYPPHYFNPVIRIGNRS